MIKQTNVGREVVIAYYQRFLSHSRILSQLHFYIYLQHSHINFIHQTNEYITIIKKYFISILNLLNLIVALYHKFLIIQFTMSFIKLIKSLKYLSINKTKKKQSKVVHKKKKKKVSIEFVHDTE